MKHLITYIIYLGIAYAVGGPLYAILDVPSWVTYGNLLIVAGIVTICHYILP